MELSRESRSNEPFLGVESDLNLVTDKNVVACAVALKGVFFEDPEILQNRQA
ncbi:conserved hypothetical protein [Roseovarius sp. EC-HK134]|nr:conserved hypothetical protein [Roseovarius sp. EC-SD190]VVT28481.1 conserved hypothetical protein [Roseovarius sp. EC-HK134]